MRKKLTVCYHWITHLNQGIVKTRKTEKTINPSHLLDLSPYSSLEEIAY